MRALLRLPRARPVARFARSFPCEPKKTFLPGRRQSVRSADRLIRTSTDNRCDKGIQCRQSSFAEQVLVALIARHRPGSLIAAFSFGSRRGCRSIALKPRDVSDKVVADVIRDREVGHLPMRRLEENL